MDVIAETKVSEFSKLIHHMSATKFLRGECQHCGGHLEFPAEAAGTAAECPHCRQQTELFLTTGETTPTRTPAKAVVFTVIACVILIGGLAGSIMALNRAKRLAAERNAESQTATQTNTVPPGPFAGQQFTASEVKLEKAQGSSVVRAAGSLKNLSPQRRFGVRVEIELMDEAEKPVGTATDYTATIEPGAVWEFKAVVLVKGAATGRVSTIKEEK